MNKRKLGKTGIEVSEIAFGGVEIGIPYGIGIKTEKDMLPEERAVELLLSALDSGINFFDTARMYGLSESLMGKAFRNRRSEVVIATKCRHLTNPDGELPPKAILKGMIEGSLEESLKALQTDYVDLFMLHQASGKILESEEILTIFSGLKDQGLFKIAGVSTYTAVETSKTIESGFWQMIQVPFNLLDQRQGVFFSAAEEKGIGIVIRSALLKGLLSNKGRNLHAALKEVENHIGGYNELLEGTDYTLASLATKFVLSFPEVSSVLVGIDKTAYLEQALDTASMVNLSEGKLKRARELAYPDPSFIDLPYWDKMNWLR